MEKDKHITEVIFRKFSGGQIIALIPYEISDYKGNVNSYMHIGQHSGATLDLIHTTKLAQEIEYRDLLNEMENLGYNIKVIQKVNRKKHANEYLKSKRQYA